MIKTRGRSGWGPGGYLPFWVPEKQGGRARRRGDGLPVVARSPGVMVCRGWPSVRRLLVVFRGWLCGGDPAAICGGN